MYLKNMSLLCVQVGLLLISVCPICSQQNPRMHDYHKVLDSN